MFCFLDLIALSMQAFVGWFSGSVCILVNDRRILSCNRRWAGPKPVSNLSTCIDVVWKHPRIVFIAVLCADTRFESCVGGVSYPYWVGLCHIKAA